MCDQAPETIHHIILGCSFSRQVWHACLSLVQLQSFVFVREEPVLEWWLSQRKCVPKQLRKGFDSLFFLIGWSLWKERNLRTFDGHTSSVQQLLASIRDEALAWCAAGHKQLKFLLSRLRLR